MRTMRVALTLMGLVAASAVSAQAQSSGPAGDVANQIFVANNSVTAVRVYVEDGVGERHQLGKVERGQTTMFEASEDVLARGDFRVIVRPCEYTQFSKDPVSIKTETLEAQDDQTVVLWLERDLSHSKVEVRQS
jgi:hypothetical protein